MENDYNDKVSRVLNLYQRFMDGEVINKNIEAERLGVSSRTIRRDIGAIRNFLDEEVGKSGVVNSIIYDEKLDGHRLEQIYKMKLSNSEILAICKILLDSRAFTKSEMTGILDRLIECCVPKTSQQLVEKLISNEEFHYVELTHKSEIMDKMWDIGQAIYQSRYLEMDYRRTKDGAVVKRKVKPVAIMFSEYYFYLTAFIDDEAVRADFDVINDAFPTIYRIDRIEDYHVLEEHFKIPYGDRFKEGEYKNRTQFMFGGEPQNISFNYYGPSVEAVLDKFPMAKVVDEKEGVCYIEAEVFGTGVKMWLLSQGSKVKVTAPETLVQEMKQEIERMNNQY